MVDMSPKTKLTIALLLAVTAIPFLVIGIIHLTVVSIGNIWGWTFLTLGIIILMTILMISLGFYRKLKFIDELPSE